MAETKRGRGRPRVDVDLDEVKELASEGNSAEDIASVLGFSKSTLFGRNDIKNAYEAGRAEMRVNLRHWQMEAAKSGNVSMLVWLGKQHLEQKEQQETTVKTQNGRLSELITGLKEKQGTREEKNDIHAETA